MPKWLNKYAKRVWTEVVPELHRLGVLAKIDCGVLASYCLAMGKVAECEEKIKADGLMLTMRDDKGNVKWVQPSPYASLTLKWTAQARTLAAELGLTPSARTRLKVPGKEPLTNKWQRFRESMPEPDHGWAIEELIAEGPERPQ